MQKSLSGFLQLCLERMVDLQLVPKRYVGHGAHLHTMILLGPELVILNKESCARQVLLQVDFAFVRFPSMQIERVDHTQTCCWQNLRLLSETKWWQLRDLALNGDGNALQYRLCIFIRRKKLVAFGVRNVCAVGADSANKFKVQVVVVWNQCQAVRVWHSTRHLEFHAARWHVHETRACLGITENGMARAQTTAGVDLPRRCLENMAPSVSHRPGAHCHAVTRDKRCCSKTKGNVWYKNG